MRSAGERLRVNVRAYLLSAADDVETAGDKVRRLCDAAVHRFDSVVATVNDKIAPSKRDPAHSAVDHLPAQGVGYGLRRPPRDVKASIVDGIDQVGDGRRTVLEQVDGEREAEFGPS
jgi:hypothetical protein